MSVFLHRQNDHISTNDTISASKVNLAVHEDKDHQVYVKVKLSITWGLITLKLYLRAPLKGS